MDFLTFVASIVSSLAWPAGIVVLVLVLREPLAALIPLLQQLKYRDLELNFGERVEELRGELEEDTTDDKRPSEDLKRILPIADVSPRAAVLEAWRDVENAAVKAVRPAPATSGGRRDLTHEAIRTLERSEKVPSNVVHVLRDLRHLRNQAAHAPEFALTKDSALQYAATASAVAQRLKGIESVSS